MKIKHIVEFYKKDRIEIIDKSQQIRLYEFKNLIKEEKPNICDFYFLQNGIFVLNSKNKIVAYHHFNPVISDKLVEEYLNNDEIHLKVILKHEWFYLLPHFRNITIFFDLYYNSYYIHDYKKVLDSQGITEDKIFYNLLIMFDKCPSKKSYTKFNGIHIFEPDYEACILDIFVTKKLTIKDILKIKLQYGIGLEYQLFFPASIKSNPKEFFIELNHFVELINKAGGNINMLEDIDVNLI